MINWYRDWQKRKKVEITYSGSESQEDIPLPITGFDHASLVTDGAASDGSDLRVCDESGNAVINHWLQSGANTASATLWVRVPRLANSGATVIYVYYDKDGAVETGDPKGIYLFYEDFEGSLIDRDVNWQAFSDGTGFSVSGGQLTGSDTTGRMQTNRTFSNSDDFVAECRFRIASRATNGHMIIGFYKNDANGVGLLAHPGADYSRNDDKHYSWGAQSIALSTWYRARMYPINPRQVRLELYNDSYSLLVQKTLDNVIEDEPLTFGQRFDNVLTGQAYSCIWDYVTVKKRLDVAPSYTYFPSEQKPDRTQEDEAKYGFAISQKGKDVNSASVHELNVNSNYQTLKIYKTGTLTVKFYAGDYNYPYGHGYIKTDRVYFDPPLGYEPLVTPPMFDLFGTGSACGPAGFAGCLMVPIIDVTKEYIELKVIYVGGDGMFMTCMLQDDVEVSYNYTIYRNPRDKQFNLILE